MVKSRGFETPKIGTIEFSMGCKKIFGAYKYTMFNTGDDDGRPF
jgi:hypothetical protein